MPSNSEICPKVEKCPIFQKGVLSNEKTGDTYKSLYCTNARYKTCKRFLASKICQKPIPVQVLPNAIISPEEIAKRINDGFYDIFNK